MQDIPSGAHSHPEDLRSLGPVRRLHRRRQGPRGARQEDHVLPWRRREDDGRRQGPADRRVPSRRGHRKQGCGGRMDPGRRRHQDLRREDRIHGILRSRSSEAGAEAEGQDPPGVLRGRPSESGRAPRIGVRREGRGRAQGGGGGPQAHLHSRSRGWLVPRRRSDPDVRRARIPGPHPLVRCGGGQDAVRRPVRGRSSRIDGASRRPRHIRRPHHRAHIVLPVGFRSRPVRRDRGAHGRRDRLQEGGGRLRRSRRALPLQRRPRREGPCGRPQGHALQAPSCHREVP